ncbi:MAG: Alpha/Beta hydrolase protein [Linnemannia gamsii]|nr:MAG: Alpha/Beta hydrolase protein [Linnemannia gamsii]
MVMATHIQDNNDTNSIHSPPVVTISGLGAVRGAFAKDTDNKVAKFLNVPFGLVQERWRPALKVQPWDGVRDGTKMGPMPPQQTDNNPFLEVFLGVPEKFDFQKEMSERDCLNCNIFMPASAILGSDDQEGRKEALPVLVWIHGGGLRNGSNSVPLYECSNLVLASIELNKPMIVVALNYRLNYLGFLSSKELLLDAQEYTKKSIPTTGQQWYDASVGNWGLLDQILGLEWIQNHIQAFSGNPKRVTVMGESGGAVAVSYLQLIPQARGLFKRSIIQSGAASMMPQMYPDQDGQAMFDRLCRLCGVPEDLPPLEKVARLRQVPAEKLIVEDMNATQFILFRPTVDGVVFSEDCRGTLGDASRYDPELEWVMTGNTADEGTMMLAQLGATTLAEYNSFITRLCPPPRSRNLHHPLRHLTPPKPTLRPKPYPPESSTITDLFKHPFGGGTSVGQEGAERLDRVCDSVLSQGCDTDPKNQQRSPCYLPFLSDVVGAGEEAVVAEKEAIVFGRDFEVSRGIVERLSAEEIAFWRKAMAFAAEQARLGKASEYGFDLAKGFKA